MTNEQIELVESSFRQVQPIARLAAQLFYSRLFEIAPGLRPLFRGDLDEQGQKLMKMIGVAVASLRRMDQLIPALEDLGRRHAQYGVRDEHFEVVGSALLWTLEQGLGEAFRPEVRQAWADLYGHIAEAMQRGAANPRAAAA